MAAGIGRWREEKGKSEAMNRACTRSRFQLTRSCSSPAIQSVASFPLMRSRYRGSADSIKTTAEHFSGVADIRSGWHLHFRKDNYNGYKERQGDRGNCSAGRIGAAQAIRVRPYSTYGGRWAVRKAPPFRQPKAR